MSSFLPLKTVLRIVFMTLLSGLSSARENPTPRFKAVAFDYFVIFDPNSVVPEIDKVFPGKGVEFAKMWRAKQFEYCYLRTITKQFADFQKVTEDALTYTSEGMKLTLSPENRRRFLDASSLA